MKVTFDLNSEDFDRIGDVIEQMTNDEKVVALICGVECVKTSKRMMSSISKNDMYREIESRFEEDLCKLTSENTDLLKRIEEMENNTDREIERITSHKLSVYDRINNEKALTIDRLNDLVRSKETVNYELREQLRIKDNEIYSTVEKEVNQRMKDERDKNNSTFSDLLKKSTSVLESMAQANAVKSSSEIGVIGEQQFMSIAKETFNDFENFDIVDVHNQPHKGDFHLSIKGITIMVDAKAYKRSVDNPQIEKIKADLRRNEHIHFAWLVSLNTSIDKRDRGVFMFEWISETQCVVHINNLMRLDNRELILKTVFYLCMDYQKKIITSPVGKDDELVVMRNKHMKISERVVALKRRIKEIKTTINSLKTMNDHMEKDVINLLNDESNDVTAKIYPVVQEWWTCRTVSDDTSCVKSTVLWNEFKKDNAVLSKEIDVSKFKDILSMIVSRDRIVWPKNKGGAIEINGYRCLPKDMEKEKSQTVLNVTTQKSVESSLQSNL
tara:strand:- start:2212 stop:3705 length:1494 start_codon:yes stop_codon:yes gene_type:complete